MERFPMRKLSKSWYIGTYHILHLHGVMYCYQNAFLLYYKKCFYPNIPA